MKSNKLEVIKKVISPRSIAVIGATEKGGLGANLMKNLMDDDKPIEIFPVNPKYDSVYGYRCYSNVKDIPKPPDTCLIAVPAKFVEQAIREAIESKVKGAIVFSSGFSEVGQEGVARQDRIVKLCDDNNFLLIGPNCLGLLNNVNNVPLFGAPTSTVNRGSIGIVAQSGSATIIMSNAGKRLGYSYLFSTGNEAQTTSEDLLEFLIYDKHTSVIGMFMEGIRNPSKFLKLSEIALDQQKPIVLLKVGRTERAAQIAKGHTGAMAGSYEIQKKALEKNGVIFVKDYSELIETLILLERSGKALCTEGVGVIAMSGGSGVLVSDVAAEADIKLADFEANTVDRLSSILPPYSSIRNPLDGVVGVYDPQAFGECIEIISEDDNVGIVTAFVDCQSGLNERQAKTQARVAVESAKAIAKLGKPGLLISNLSDSYSNIVEDAICDYNIPALKGTREAMLAINHLLFYSKTKRNLEERRNDSAAVYVPNEQNQALLKHYSTHFPQANVPVYDASHLISQYGIDIPRSYLASTEEDALIAARKIGYPLVMKIEASEIVHKSDEGFVMLGLESDEQVVESYQAMKTRYLQLFSDRKFNVMMQEMADAGIELVLGVKYDEQFGPALILGWGGVFVEILRTYTMEVLPLSRREVYDMISRMPGSEILKGFRGNPEADIDALADTILAFMQMVNDGVGLIEEAEINPLIVYQKGKGVKAVDARIIMK